MSKKKTNGNMQLRALVDSAAALQMLAQQHLPAVTAFKLGRIMRAVNPLLENYDQQRTALIRKYGAEQEDGSVTVAPGNAEFEKELGALLDVDVTLSFEPLPLSVLEGHVLQPAHLMYLDWLFDEDAQTAKNGVETA